ncbi:MAG: type-F conjugative transfer system secretin TraK [Pseudomonadota bacterium]
MVRDFGSFAQGASVGAILAAVTLLAPSANADTEGDTTNSPVQITRTTTTSQGATRTTVRPNDGTGANAKVTGGDWGSMSVDVEDGQRISAILSYGEVTRMSFRNDRAAHVRIARNERPGAVLVAFERDEVTGDVYFVVEQGQPGGIVSAFVTTEAGETYHVMFTVRDQPAAQIFISGGPARAADEVQEETPLQATTYEGQLIEFAAFIQEQAENLRHKTTVRTIRSNNGVDLMSAGRISHGGFEGEVYEVHNRGTASFAVDHDAFWTDGALAVVSAHDTINPGTFSRVFVVYRRGATQ